MAFIILADQVRQFLEERPYILIVLKLQLDLEFPN